MYRFLICIKRSIFIGISLIFCNQLYGQPIDKQLDSLIQSLDSLSDFLKASTPFKFDATKTVQENLTLNGFTIREHFLGGYFYINKINDQTFLFLGVPPLSNVLTLEYRYELEKKELQQNVLQEREKEISDLKAEITPLYKIHLMPINKEQMAYIFMKMFNDLKKDPKLKEAIRSMKYKQEINTLSGQALLAKLKFTSDLSEDYYWPLIVMYVYGKDDAQYLVNYLYKNFGNLQGLGKTPRYNEKVTSLIYFAQGDGDYKEDKFKDYYESNRVYYRPDFESPPRNYHLKNPALEQ